MSVVPYTVHRLDVTYVSEPSFLFVPDSFSFAAFFFTFFWMLHHKLWRPLAAYGALLVISVLGALFGGPALIIPLVMAKLYFGFEAFEILRNALVSRGNLPIMMLFGPNRANAEKQFFEGYVVEEYVVQENANRQMAPQR